MSEELYDPDAFEIKPPVWFLVNRDTIKIPDAGGVVVLDEHTGFVGAELQDGKGKILALFTDEDLAERFVKENKVANALPLSGKDEAYLVRVVELAAAKGFTHVGFDMRASGQKIRWGTTIDVVLRKLRHERE